MLLPWLVNPRPDPALIVVDIDRDTLGAIRFLALAARLCSPSLVGAVSRAGPAAIGLDVLLDRIDTAIAGFDP